MKRSVLAGLIITLHLQANAQSFLSFTANEIGPDGVELIKPHRSVSKAGQSVLLEYFIDGATVVPLIHQNDEYSILKIENFGLLLSGKTFGDDRN